MALELTPAQWLKRLETEHNAELPTLHELNSYYEGEQPLSYMAPELEAELGDRLRQVVINWPRLVVDSVEERLDVLGFRLAGEAAADEELGRMWQDNDLDEWSQQAAVDALVMKRSYVFLGSNEEDAQTPLITVESPLEAYAIHDPRTRRVAAAYKIWCDTDAEGKKHDFANVYLPNQTVPFYKEDGRWVEDTENIDNHDLGTVPVVPLINRARVGKMQGVSELKDVIPLSDAACKIATDMMVTAEFHAAPRRWALGFGPEDFQDENGNKISAFSQVIGRMWASEKSKTDGAEVGQFPEADLRNFHDTLNQLARIVSSLAALTPQSLGFTTDNPASADAIRSSETRLVKRAERKQRPWSGTWEQVMRIADRIRTGEWRPELKRMETLWANAATPTIAQSADAAVKLHADGVVPLRQTREDLRYTDAQIKRMEEEDDKALARQTDAMFGTPKVPDPPPPAPQPDQVTIPVAA